MTPEEIVEEINKLSENEQNEVIETLKRLIAEDEAALKTQFESVDKFSENQKDRR